MSDKLRKTQKDQQNQGDSGEAVQSAEKPVSLHPLGFEEALGALLKASGSRKVSNGK